MYKKYMISQSDNAETKLTVRGSLKLFRALHEQSKYVYPLQSGGKGPKGSASRFMIMASLDKLKQLNIFDDRFITEINPYS